GYLIRRARPDRDRAALERLAGSAAWTLELSRAVRGEPAGVFVADKGGELAAFAAHDGNNHGLGWFGPAKTAPAHQGRGLGRALLLACLLDVADRGERQCVISWIGPRSFYDRTVGIAASLRHVVLRKPLAP